MSHTPLVIGHHSKSAVNPSCNTSCKPQHPVSYELVLAAELRISWRCKLVMSSNDHFAQSESPAFGVWDGVL